MINIRSVLALKDTPIVLGIILAIGAWMANRLIDTHTSSPLVEYSHNWLDSSEYKSKYVSSFSEALTCGESQVSVGNPQFILEVPIRNLSTDTKLDNIQLDFSYPPNAKAKVLGMRLASKAPAVAENESDQCGADFVILKNLTFQPGAEYTVLLALTEMQEPLVTLAPSTSTVRVQKSNFVTWTVRNQTELMLGFLIAISLLAVRYLSLLVGMNTQAKRGNS